MSLEELSKTYSDACCEMHNIITTLYEDLHYGVSGKYGTAINAKEEVLTKLERLSDGIKAEADAIMDACKESNGIQGRR